MTAKKTATEGRPEATAGVATRGNPTARDATFNDLELPRPETVKFLQRVLARIMRVTLDEGGEIVARIEVNWKGIAPGYRLERPRGKVLVSYEGVRHTRTKGKVFDTDKDWSSTTMSYSEISEILMCRLSDEFRELIGSRPSSE